jgi:hypothetical protein
MLSSLSSSQITLLFKHHSFSFSKRNSLLLFSNWQSFSFYAVVKYPKPFEENMLLKDSSTSQRILPSLSHFSFDHWITKDLAFLMFKINCIATNYLKELLHRDPSIFQQLNESFLLDHSGIILKGLGGFSYVGKNTYRTK